MKRNYDRDVQLIPLDKVRVLNPRSRSHAKFQEIVDSIASVGLKRPITVSSRTDRDGEEHFVTGYGEGRIESYKAHGQTAIPALVIDVTDEELLLISLTENLARRHCAGVEQMWEILDLKERGYKTAEISRKVGLNGSYVSGIVRLLQQGEERLVQAVVKGQMALKLAMTVASEDDEDIRRALHEAYENKSLRGNKLLLVRNVISRRQDKGKKLYSRHKRTNGKPTSNDLVRVYQKETSRQRAVIAKSKLCETRLVFAISAIKSLFEDDGFVTLLRAESLDTLPSYLAQELEGKGE